MVQNETFFQTDTNFNIAFEVVDIYDFDSDIRLDYFGYLEVQATFFKTDENNRPLSNTALGVHRCTIEDYETKFHHEENEIHKDWFDGELLCLDKPELINLRGQLGGLGL